MRIKITKINKRNLTEMMLYKYRGSKKKVALCLWYELLEPRYTVNKESFLIAWKQFMGGTLDIVVDDRLKVDILIDYLNYFDSSKLEAFLERIWLSNYKFIMVVK